MSEAIAEALVVSGYQTAWVVSGGGSSAVATVLSVAGASVFMREAQIPYSAKALRAYGGLTCDALCSSRVAGAISRRAYARAEQFADGSYPCAGIACTAALQTNRERRGADRAHLAVAVKGRYFHRYLALDTGSRLEQEAVLSAALLAYVKACLEGV
jgi:nicotinamide mononucleotide (NMN) deamidase PncC